MTVDDVDPEIGNPCRSRPVDAVVHADDAALGKVDTLHIVANRYADAAAWMLMSFHELSTAYDELLCPAHRMPTPPSTPLASGLTMPM